MPRPKLNTCGAPRQRRSFGPGNGYRCVYRPERTKVRRPNVGAVGRFANYAMLDGAQSRQVLVEIYWRLLDEREIEVELLDFIISFGNVKAHLKSLYGYLALFLRFTRRFPGIIGKVSQALIALLALDELSEKASIFELAKKLRADLDRPSSDDFGPGELR